MKNNKYLGHPQPQYQWLRNGSPVTEFRDIEIYKISQTTKNDTGSYQCLARNEAGTIFSEKSEVVVACESRNFVFVDRGILMLILLPFSFHHSAIMCAQMCRYERI